MAISHLSVKVGSTGKAGPHAAYVARDGKYADRLEKGERLEATEAGNMPAWAQANPQEFWQAADRHERSNGTTYREFEIALPRELAAADRLSLVREFVAQELGDRHAYQFAIHCPTAVDGKEQPHAHVMFSERQRDGIERDPDQYFKRYNAKAPEKGGAKKGWGEHAGQTRSKAERAADLKALRQRWETTCNAALERAGHAERIDLRSNAERGISLLPERKMRPSEWRTRRAEVIEFRQARAELSKAVPDVAAEIINLEQRRREAERPKGADRPGHAVSTSRFNVKKRQEAQRREAERREAEAVAKEQARIDRARLAARPIEEQIKAHEYQQKRFAIPRQERLLRIRDQARARLERRKRAEKDAWAREPQPPTGLLASFKQKAYEQARSAHRREIKTKEALTAQATKLANRLSELAQSHLCMGWAYGRLKAAEPELTARIEAHRAAERAKQDEARRQQAKLTRGKGRSR